MSDIKFFNNACDTALEAYLNMIPHPTKTNNEFIKIHHMTQSIIYDEDVLIQYSTKLERIIDEVESKLQPKLQPKPKSTKIEVKRKRAKG